jgi:hypothetical protein
MAEPNARSPVKLPGDTIVQAANRSFQDDANFRERVRRMHEAGYPLVKMVQDLGLDGAMSDEVRQVIESLPPSVVEGIRQATLAMLDAGTNELPLDCAVEARDLPDGVAVNVAVLSEHNVPTIVVRPSTTTS